MKLIFEWNQVEEKNNKSFITKNIINTKKIKDLILLITLKLNFQKRKRLKNPKKI